MTGALAAIVFDFDGVIADSERLHLRSYQDILAARGLTMEDEVYYAEYLGYDDAGVFRTYARTHELPWGDQTIAELIGQKGARFEVLSSEGEMLFAGAERFIRDAAARVPLAIASGALTYEIEEVLERAALRPLFAAIVGADQTRRSKPSPDPYLEAVSRLRATGVVLDAHRTVAIEDSRWDLVSARTAGLRTVAVTTTYTASELAGDAELVVSGLHALTVEALEALCASPAARPSGEPLQPGVR
ncbi:MAG: HAD family hydrolase [Acidobacteriota bacterium]